MKIVILGGTGLIGSYLKQFFEKQNHSVSCLGREVFQASFNLAGELNGIDLLINLSGANIGQRWPKGYQDVLWNSRVQTTQQVAQVIKSLSEPPKRVIAASAIGFYPESDCAHPVDESTTQPGDNFLAKLSVAWEDASRQLADKVLIFRFGVVLSTQGGALQKMLPPFKLGLGGPVAGGNQCFSWIHIEDLAQGFLFALNHPEMQGIYNLTAPHPLTQKAFGQTLATTLNRPFFLPLPLWQLKLMFGKGAQVLTHSSAVLPSKLITMGFQFHYPTAESALQNLLTAKS
ncbi:TIGR01777 family oxidoreductase [Hydrogenovibrio sp. 3SP14C1]|uniref:TIGR01777 family oxidoreductase n=1 Tax=Hydrogenovibrio sp. 3SP14C1 TaxID=3038774 RepID=UPI002417440E|nr:TIGR01777 family oxidoreductase [Hydrogenovibrio sp. 3SP14C1]MDG4813135.1 TIGR01777 family oxidoreductase [Hydrogenovibrio sp. 3SP14C1]